jgi:hypothetical protein
MGQDTTSTSRFSRRRILQVTGAAIAGGAAATGSVAASTDGEGARNGSASSSSGEFEDRGPLGGHNGYDRVVREADADVVVGSSEELEDALSSASSGDVVFVAGDAEIDAGETTFTVPSGVTLASNRGVDGTDGGLVQTEAEIDVVRVEGDARVTGLRVQGPFYEYFDPSWYAEGTGLRAVDDGIEIDNCEVWGFADAAIHADGDVRVHHSHVHHNPRDGLGYGVLCAGGHPTIEWNYFNYNRHSVASTGGHHGYTVRFNHFAEEAVGGVIDIHKPGGTSSEVHNNIVVAVDDVTGDSERIQAIQIRGVPDETYAIHDNWFFNPEEPLDSPSGSWTEEAIIQPTETEWRNVDFHDNHYGPDANVSASDVIPGYGN